MTKSTREVKKYTDINSLTRKNTLEQSLQQLPNERQPERDLWPGIKTVINGDSQHKPDTLHHFSFIKNNSVVYCMAACSVLLVCTLVLSIYNTWVLNQWDNQAFHQQIDKEFMLARQQLILDKNAMSAETYQLINKNLNIIRQAKSDIRKALKNDPNNMVLMKQLLRVQNEELTVMNRTNSIKKL